jgi:hypothetical protein
MGLEMEMDDGSTARSSSSAFVEMSTLEKGKTARQDGGGFDASESVSKPAAAEDMDILSSTEALSPSTLPTASPTAPHESLEDSQRQNSEYESTQAASAQDILQFLPHSQSHMIRTVMTMLLALLVAGILCTFLLVPQYAVFLALLWTLLISLFAALAWFVQNAVLKNRSTVLHPYLHAAAAAVMTEYQLFSQDWRDEVLMLTNEAEHPDKQVDLNARAGTYAMMLPPPPKRKGKSKLFRLVVRPFLPMLSRRRQRKKEQKEANPPASSYVPPEMDHA